MQLPEQSSTELPILHLPEGRGKANDQALSLIAFMKRTTALLTALLCLTIAAQAQQQSKYFTELSIGPSFPIGRFAATSTASSKKVAGFAKPGLAAQLSGGYYLNPSYGILASIGYATHPQDEQARKKMFESLGYETRSINCENWKEIKLMAGGFYVTSLGTKLRLSAKLAAGVVKTGIPKINWYGYRPNSIETASSANEKISMPWAFCYQAGAALQYKLNQKWYALVDASFFNATATYKYDYSGVAGIPGGGPKGKSRYALTTINTLLGVGVNL